MRSLYALTHQVLVAGWGFGLILLLVRIMPQTEFGSWILLVSVFSISEMLMHGLLQTIVAKESASRKARSSGFNSLVSNAFALAIGLFVVVNLVAQGIRIIFPSQTINWFTTWYPLLGLVSIPFNLFSWILSGQEDFKGILIQRIILILTSMLCLGMWYMLKGELSIQSMLWSQLSGYASASVLALVDQRMRIGINRVTKKEMTRLLHYGKFTFGTLLGSSLLRNADTFMIGAFMNTSAVAIYGMAQKVLEFFEVILRSVAARLFPRLLVLRKDKVAVGKLVRRHLKVVLCIFLLMASFVLIFAEQVIGWMSSAPEYGESIVVLRIFMIYVMLLPLDRFMGIVLEIFDQPGLNFTKTIFLVVANVGGNFIAIYHYQSLALTALVSSIALVAALGAGGALAFYRKFGTVRFTQIRKLLFPIQP